MMVNEDIENQESGEESLYGKISYKNMVTRETFGKNNEILKITHGMRRLWRRKRLTLKA